MRRKQKKSTPIVFICSIIAGIFILTGCYLKQKPPGHFSAAQNAGGSKKPLQNHWDKFFSDVKKVDGRAKAHYDMAVYFQKRKKHNLAVQDFQKAIQFDPTDEKIYNAMGISYDKTGDYLRAIRCYEMAIKLNPEMASAYNNLGYSKMLMGDTKGAIEKYQQAIDLDDTNPKYRNNLDMLYAKKGNTEQARDQLEVHDDLSTADLKLDRLLGNSTGFTTRKKHSIVSEILKEDSNHNQPFTSQRDTLLSVGLKETPNNNSVAVSNIGDVPDTPNIDETDESVVAVVYNDESNFVTNSAGNEYNNEKDVTDENEYIIEEEIKNRKPELKSVSQDNESAIDVLLYAVNVTTEPQRLTFQEDERVAEILDNEIPGETPKEPTTQSGIIEVIFQDDSRLTYDIEKQTPVNKNVQIQKGDMIDTPRDSHISYESVEIIEVGSPKKSSSQLLLAGLKLAETKRRKNKGDIEVSNGNGIQGAASRLATQLKSKGFIVSKVSNARSFDHLSTKVLFRTENIDYVFPLLNELPLLIEDSDMLENNNMKTNIRIIIGKDMAQNR